MPAELAALRAGAVGRRQRADLHLRRRRASARGIAALLDDLTRAGIRFKDLQTTQSSLEDIFVSLVRENVDMNLHAIRAIYRFEMARTWRTLMQSIVSPVISTSLYFVVFGAAIGSRISADRRRQLRRLHRARA